MKVIQEKLPASQMGLEIEISPEMSKKAYEQVIQEFTRSANIPGFRKGKVPRQVLLQRFGSTRIKAAALEELIQSSIKEAIAQEKIAALGNYQLRTAFEELILKFEPGQSLTFSAAVDVQPEVKLSQYQGLTLQVEEVKPNSNQVDELLEQRRNSLATLIPVEERAAQMGDVAIVDFAGKLADDPETGEPGRDIPGGQGQDFQVELAVDKFIPGFVDGVVGMKPGETKEVSAQFPEGYPEADIAGKPAVFTISLKELKEKEPPELDDEFAQEISEFETLAELRESLETRFREEAEQKTANNKEQAILNELIKYIEVDLPATLIEQEVDYMLTQTAMRLQNQGIDYKQLFTQEMLPELRKQSQPEAIARIKRTLALGEVAKQESIQVEAAEVAARVNEMMAQYKDREVDEQRLRQVVEEDLLKDKIVAWLAEHSTIELVPEGTLQIAEEDIEASPADDEKEAVAVTAEVVSDEE